MWVSTSGRGWFRSGCGRRPVSPGAGSDSVGSFDDDCPEGVVCAER